MISQRAIVTRPITFLLTFEDYSRPLQSESVAYSCVLRNAAETEYSVKELGVQYYKFDILFIFNPQ